MKNIKKLAGVFSGFFLLCGCGLGAGQLSLSLTDAATDRYEAVYVTVYQVQLHRADIEGDGERLKNQETAGNEESGNEVVFNPSVSGEEEREGEWFTVASPKKTLNLLMLANGVRESLGITSLPPGHYSQMRLVLGKEPDDGINILGEAHPFANYVITSDKETHEVKVPSGFQTGIKVVHEFDINRDETTDLILDFDASRSIVIAGSSGKYILKPTIRILETVEASRVNGQVNRSSDGSPLEGIIVSAQVADPGATDIKDQVSVQSSGISDGNGRYALFFAAGDYQLVVYKEGFLPSFEGIATSPGDLLLRDFFLDETETGRVSGSVMIGDAGDETFASLSFRQEVEIDGIGTTVELVFLNVAHGGDFSVALPPGEYSLVAWTFGKTTQSATVTVVAGSDAEHDVSF